MSESNYEFRKLKISSQNNKVTNKINNDKEKEDIKECLKLLFSSIEDIKNSNDIDYSYVSNQLENYIFMLEDVLECYYNFCSDKLK